MLIVAIPKSASTSLMKTIGKVKKLPAKQVFGLTEDYEIPESYKYLGKNHSDIVQIDNQLVNIWENQTHIFKQHTPPTENNLSQLKNQKKIVLLRSPEQVLLAYRRAVDSGVHKRVQGLEGCKSELEWMNRAIEIGLYKELFGFYRGWLIDSLENANTKVIYYSHLVNRPSEIMNEVFVHFGLSKIDQNVTLIKSRYSHYKSYEKAFININKYI